MVTRAVTITKYGRPEMPKDNTGHHRELDQYAFIPKALFNMYFTCKT